MPQKIQILRTSTPNQQPAALSPGELAIEMASVPPRLWVGVPTAIDAAGMKLLLPSGGVAVADTPPAAPKQGDLWWESDTGILWIWFDDGTSSQWVQAAGSGGSTLDAYTKAEIDAKQAQDQLDFVNVTGDTMTGNLLAPGLSIQAGEFLCSGGPGIFRADAISTVVHFHTAAHLAFIVGTGAYELAFNATFYGHWQLNGSYTILGEGYKAVAGPWAAISDERIKNVLGNYTQGLAALKQLNPVRYTLKGNVVTHTSPLVEADDQAVEPGQPNPRSAHYQYATAGKECLGLVAQQAELVMPELVTQRSGEIDGAAVTDLREIDITGLTYALINAVKELSAANDALTARITALEGAR